MKDTIEISILGRNSIVLGHDLFEFIGADLKQLFFKSCRTFVIITDNNVANLYLQKLCSAMQKNVVDYKMPDGVPSKRLLTYTVPSGELSKSRDTKAKIEDFLAVEGCNRDTCILALGGGVIGDLAGFVASTWNRGVAFVQIPTTLLAMVDSSIGGKNGVDTKYGKNLIGTIYQPARIYIDCDFLQSLPQREFYNGMAEIIKTAAISSMEEFYFLEENAVDLARFIHIQNLNPHQALDENFLRLLISIISSSAKYKAKVVNLDCKDTGIRNLLNFGHTIGHGIELFMAPRLLHGECVSIGMILETKVANRLGICNDKVVERLESMLNKFELPTSIVDEILKKKTSLRLPNLYRDKVYHALKLDKKNLNGSIHMTLLEEIGVPFKLNAVPVKDSEILNILSELEVGYSQIIDTADELNTSVFNKDAPIVLIGENNLRIKHVSINLAAHMGYKFLNVESIECWTQEYSKTVINIACEPDDMKLVKLLKNDRSGIVIHLANTSLAKYHHIYEENSHFTFVLLENDNVNQVVHLIKYACGNLYDTCLPPTAHLSFFLTLFLEDLGSVLSDLRFMTNGIHALEVRVDKLVHEKLSRDNLSEVCLNIATQISLIRRFVEIPLIYTLRTRSEGGYLPDTTEPEIIKTLYVQGIRLGCEILDIEAISKSKEHIDNVVRPVLSISRGMSRIIASYHHISEPLDWEGPFTYEIINQCASIGDVIKLVSVANSPKDNRKLEEFLEVYTKSNEGKPLIALNIGKIGQVSRIMNKYFTPVTSESLKPRPELCQLTIKQILTGATLMGSLVSKQYFLFGTTISHSISPLVHNTIFDYFGFPHKYSIFETPLLLDTTKIIRSTEFGGASITMPFKESVISMLDSLSESAKEISAVNTIIVQSDGKLYGDNTDWLGVKHCIQRHLKTKPKAAICFGAGGTALSVIYALRSLEISLIYVMNRTKTRLDRLVEKFPMVIPVEEVSEIMSFEDAPSIIIDTTPNDSTLCTNAIVNSILDTHKGNGIFVKLAYQGLKTKSAINLDIEFEAINSNTVIIKGEDVLIEQALWQNYFWTGLKMNSEFLREEIYDLLN